MRKTITAILAVILLTACGGIGGPDKVFVGGGCPAFSVTLNNGETVNESTVASERTLIMFFHTASPACQKQLSALKPFYDIYRKEVNVVLISCEEGPEEVQSYWKKNCYDMPYSAQKDKKVYNLFTNSGLPFTVLFDNGRAVGIWDDTHPFSDTGYTNVIHKR